MDEVNLAWRRVNAIRGGVNLTWRRVNAIRGGVNLTWRRVNAFHGWGEPRLEESECVPWMGRTSPGGE
jgi:hypothetical protein